MQIQIPLIFILYQTAKSQQQKVCEISNYCNGDKTACSMNGNCHVDIFSYYSKKAQPSEKEPKCFCHKGYKSFTKEEVKDDIVVSTGKSFVYCCYKQKKMFIAFLLEVIIGFGAGHFYVGDNIVGTVKMVIQLIICALSIISLICFCRKEVEVEEEIKNLNNDEEEQIKNNENKFNIYHVIIIGGFGLHILINVVDSLFIACGVIKDGNGVELEWW